MIYGTRHSDKCSDKELLRFKNEVLEYLNELQFIGCEVFWKTIRAFNCFGGQVKVYTGKTIERIPLKRRRRLVAYIDTNGKIQGNEKAGIELLTREGNQLWERHSELIKEPECFSLFRSEWYSKDKEIADEERRQLKKFLTPHIG